jgi:hypothetical protein
MSKQNKTNTVYHYLIQIQNTSQHNTSIYNARVQQALLPLQNKSPNEP